MNGDMKKFTYNFKTKPKKKSLSAGVFKFTFPGSKKIPKGRKIPSPYIYSLFLLYFLL